ncbi:fasciclin domain-containing protein [Bacteroides sp. 224]|uniref:fasciclin domain-containing protein n=1 Tax=Bacteroides sp. 224 TaxID=2302936 RepID=UPI0013D20C79|nr:hypothetical protein [Bacteroides sp. 224]
MNYLKRNIFLLPAILLFLSACSDSDTGDSEENDSTNIETILSELEKETDISIFTESLKSADLQDINGPVTIFAIQNDALSTRSSKATMAIGKDELLYHIIKGAYSDLSQISNMTTLNKQSVDIETIYVKNTPYTYVNDVIINSSPTILEGGNVLYKTNLSLLLSRTPPSKNNNEEYIDWLAMKLEGEWILVDNESYNIYVEDYNKKEITPIDSKDSRRYQYREIFERDRTYYSKGMLGKYEAVYNKEEHSIIKGTGSRADKAWFGLSTSDNQEIALSGRTVLSNGQSYPVGTMHIDENFGIGSHMKYIICSPGYSLNPPMLYPAERDSLVYIFQKICN